MTDHISAQARQRADDSVPDLVELDATVRRLDGLKTLVGGSPLRILRLSEAGGRALDALLAGGRVPLSKSVRQLVRRLLDAGLLHPAPNASLTPGPTMRLTPGDVVGVIPVRDDPAGAARAASSLLAEGVGAVIVVDDGSADPSAIEAALADQGVFGDSPSGDSRVRILHHVMAAGPGAARDSGWRSVDAPVFVFCDADVVGEAGWLSMALDLFVDPSVGVVGPRVRAQEGTRLLDRYEALRSPLDLGSLQARVRPRSRVPYLPAAALLIRREALLEVKGFDPGLRYGEDVDLVWRIDRAGWVLRYEPRAVVRHRSRPNWVALGRQRQSYGSAAAPLAVRHPGALAPYEANVWTALAWAAVLVGGKWGRRVAVGVGVASTLALAPKLRGRLQQPVREAFRLAGMGHLWGGLSLAVAIRRAWLPLAALLAWLWPPSRGPLGAAVVVPPFVEWCKKRPEIDPLRWMAAYLSDDASYCAGLWRGCWRERNVVALVPQISLRTPELTTPQPAADALESRVS